MGKVSWKVSFNRSGRTRAGKRVTTPKKSEFAPTLLADWGAGWIIFYSRRCYSLYNSDGVGFTLCASGRVPSTKRRAYSKSDLQNGGTIEHAQQIANHESPRTTKLYDRTSDAISLDEIERILI